MAQIQYDYLNELFLGIPITKDWQLSILELNDDSLKILTKIQPHLNYQNTAFGGSLNSINILSCYLMIHHLIKINGYHLKSLVIQKSDINYLKPVSNDFITSCELKNKNILEKFFLSLDRKKIGRIYLKSFTSCNKNTEINSYVTFNGIFVVKVN